MKKKYLLVVLLYLFCTTIFAKIEIIEPNKSYSTSFAICIDEVTYNKTKDAVIAYKDAIEHDGISAYVVIVDDETPEEIKETLQDLYDKKPILEGAVFIGDIPIPMIRDAQHLTSAFKMNQDRYDWIDSSVPSDRFYEDFDLKFEYLKQDSTNKLCYYYSLLAESPQKIEKEIYSGRIKAPKNDNTKYKLINAFLIKAAKAKYNLEELDNAMVFSGHGYKSESLVAWADEQITLREQFPQLFKSGGVFKNLIHSMNDDMKSIVMSELSRPELDFALFHAHGSETTQYFLGLPSPQNVKANIETVKLFVRSKLRAAKRRKKNIEELKQHYIDEYKIPEEWTAGAFDPEMIKADSLFDDKLDLHSVDLDKFTPQAKFIIFDQCFNGAFIVEDYISGRYVFDEGNVICANANSVNVLQNKWVNEFLGLLNYGVSTGQWHKNVDYLENHIIGDPTFHYKNNKNIKISTNMALEYSNSSYWKQFLNNDDDAIRGFSIARVAELEGSSFDKELEKIYKTDPSNIVRAEALNKLAFSNSKTLNNILNTSIKDPNEFVRRISSHLMGKIGDDKYIPALVNAMMRDQGDRVSFVAKGALQVMDQNKVEKEFEKLISTSFSHENVERREKFLKHIVDRNKSWLFKEIIPKIKNDSLKLSKRISTARSVRNINFRKAIPPFLEIIKNVEQPKKLRIATIESLGWFTFNKDKSIIIDALNKMIEEDDDDDDVLNEAIKSRKRLQYGSNVSFTP